MRSTSAVRVSVLAMSTLAAAGVIAATATAPTQQSTTGSVQLAALPALSFPTGVYMENRVSDHVTLPPGTVLVFQGLPPGLSYDGGTTAIKGVPTTPGVYHPVATAYIGGVPVRTESTTVTITGNAVPGAPAPAGNNGGGNAGGAPAPAAPAPGTIDIAGIQNLPLPEPVKDALVNAARGINDGIQAAWNAVPAGSLGK